MKASIRRILLLVTASIAACASPVHHETNEASRAPVTLLAFGDSGYHYDHLEAEDYDAVVTMEQFIEAEREEWIEDKRPIEELAYPPTYTLPHNGSTIAASGLAPVATAMKNFCREHGCDFATMLGDNIYPDGAQAGADGGDAQRFHDLFTIPFAPLAEGNDKFRIYTVLGNHDWHTSREGAMAQVRFMETSPPFYMRGLFYRVTPPAAHGQVEIFAIDTEVLLAGTSVYEPALAEDGRQLVSNEIEAPEPWAVPQDEAERNMVAWLESALANSPARWKIVIGHHPLWSTAGSKFEQAKALRRLILPVLCRHADMYLAGHEHTLEVHTDDCSTAAPGRNVGPLPTVVSGSASKMRPTHSAFIRQQSKAHPQLHTLWAKGLVWGFAHLTFVGDQVTVKMVETAGDGSGGSQVTFEHSFVRRTAGD